MRRQFEGWLKNISTEACLSDLETLSDSERQDLWSVVKDEDFDLTFRKGEEGSEEWWSKVYSHKGKEAKRRKLIQLVYFATCPAKLIRRNWTLRGWLRENDQQTCRRLFSCRPMEWRIAAIESVDFLQLHDLVVEGILERPTDGPYYHKLLERGVHLLEQTRYEFLKSNPGLLDIELWRLFEIEGTQEVSFANCDKYCSPGNSWSVALQTLSQDGRVSRKKLLEASLKALNRGFIQYRASWFSRFHEDLKPTIEERSAFTDLYLPLLQSPIRPTVVFAAKALAKLHKVGAVNEGELLHHLEPVFRVKTKSTVKEGLKLVAKIGSNPNLNDKAINLASIACEHEDPGIQTLALATIEALGGKKEALGSLLDHVALSVRQDVIGDEKDGVASAAVTSIKFDSIEWQQAPPLRGSDAIDPISNIEDLIDAATQVVEGYVDPVKLELVMDGFARMGREFFGSEWNKRIDTLAARCRKLIEQSSTWSDASHWVLPAIDAKASCPKNASSHVVSSGGKIKEWDQILALHGKKDLWLARFESVIRDVRAGFSRPLLSLPSHRPYLLDPVALKNRLRILKKSGAPKCKADAQVAQIRIPGKSNLPELKISCKRLYQDCEFALTRRDYLTHFSVTTHDIRPYCQMGINELLSNHDFHTALWDQKFVLEPLFDSDVELVSEAQDLLAWCLGCKEAGMSGMAVDLAILSIEDGRVTPSSLGQSLHNTWSKGILPLRRHASSLLLLAECSELHQFVVDQAVEGAFAGLDPKAQPRDLSNLLQTFHETRLNNGGFAIQNNETRVFLEGVTGKGKAKQLANKLLQLAGSFPAPLADSIVAQQELCKKTRANRWKGGKRR